MLAAMREGLKHVYLIESPEFNQLKISRTFHGRDIFAPVAAYLAKEVEVTRFGREICDYLVPRFAEPRFEKNKICGEIMYIDNFGNLITNTSEELFNKIGFGEVTSLEITFQDEIHSVRFSFTYGDVTTVSPLALIGSHGNLEISFSQGNAQQFFSVKIGDSIMI